MSARGIRPEDIGPLGNVYKPEPSAEPECDADPGPYFCVCCDEANVTRCDEDRCCVACGFDLVPLSQMRTLLSRAGLTIVPAADVPSAEERKVLEALSRARIGAFCDDAPTPHLDLEDDGEIAALELARRAAKGPK